MKPSEQHPVLLLTEKQAADALGLKVRTLQAWRHKGGKVPYVKISSRCIRYRLSDLEAFAAERIQTSTSQNDDGAES